MPGQQTFDDVRRSLDQSKLVKSLNHTQLNIIAFLEKGYYPGYIADRLKISRSYVSRTTKKLSELDLIAPSKSRDPLQGRAGTYQVSTLLKSLLIQHGLDKSASYTFCTPHHVKLKFPILHMKGELRIDGWKFSRQHATHIRSWKPKGPERHLFHVTTQQGGVGVEYHGKSLLAYRLGHDHIMADSVESATRLAMIQVQEGTDMFIREQAQLGTRMELGRPKISDTPHYAFESEAAREIIKAGGKIDVPGIWADKSPEGQGRPFAGDIETRDPVIATMVDRGLRNAMNIEGIVQEQITGAIPVFVEAIDQRIAPLRADVESLSERVDKGNTLTAQFNQLVNILQNTVKDLENLKQKQEQTQTPELLPEKEDLNGMYQ